MRHLARPLASAAAALAGAAVAYLALPEPYGRPVALALAASGVFAGAVLRPSGTAERHARAAGAGAGACTSDLAEALALVARPVFVPAGGNLPAPRLFLPADESSAPLPAFDASTKLYSAPAGTRPGVLVEPPALALLTIMEADAGSGARAASVEQARDLLAAAGAQTGLWSRVSVSVDDGYLARFRPGPAATCADPEAAALCARGFCVACGAHALVLARVAGRPLVLDEAAWVDGDRSLRLREAAV